MGESPDRSTYLSDSHDFSSSSQTLAVAAHLVVPKCEGQSKRGWFSMNSVSAANLGRVFKLKRPALEHIQKSFNLLEKNIARVTQKQRIGRINHIGRSQAIMDESGGFSDVFCQVGCEGNYVVVGGFFDLIDSFDR